MFIKRKRKRDEAPPVQAWALFSPQCSMSFALGKVRFFPSPDGLLHHIASALDSQVQAACAPSIQVAASYIQKL